MRSAITIVIIGIAAVAAVALLIYKNKAQA